MPDEVKRAKYAIDDGLKTTNDDAIRVWMTTGDTPNETFSVSVMVRCVSDANPLHEPLANAIVGVCRQAVEGFLKEWEKKSSERSGDGKR